MTHQTILSIHRTREEILDIVPQWLQLLQVIEDRAFYHHPAWFLALHDTLCKDSLQLLYVESNGLPLAIVPFQINPRSQKISGPKHDHISLTDWVCRSSEAIRSIVENSGQLEEKIGINNWNKFSFELVPEDSLLTRFFSTRSAPQISTASQSNRPWRLKLCRESFWFECEGTVNDTTGKPSIPISGKLRRNLKRYRTKLQEHGELGFTMSSENSNRAGHEDTNLAAAFNSFLDIEASGWKGESGTAISQNPVLVEFYRILLETRMEDWNPSINLLSMDGTPIAAQFQIRTGRTSSLLKVGYDEQWAHCSPGSLALESFLEICCNDNRTSRLSLVTCPEWAERWHPKRNNVLNLYFYNRNIHGKLQTVIDNTREKLKKKTSTLRRAG